MAVKGFGINADAGRLDGNLEVLGHDLEYFQRVGFDYVEMPVHGVGAVLNGRLVPEQVKKIQSLLKRFPFRYTVHAPNPLNLMNFDEEKLHRELFKSSIEFAHAIGAEILVYHCGRYIAEEEFLLPHRRHVIEYEQQELMKRAEVELLREMADFAGERGVIICMENARPYLDGGFYCYGERLDLLVEQVRAINRKNVGITLDLGHAFLAARTYNFDLLEGIKLAKPYIKHLHVHDNFGKPNASYEKKQPELVATGRGDCHMPIGWGMIPFKEIFAMLDTYDGVLMQELRPRYMPYLYEALASARTLAREVGWI
ncbi:Sugar phosphate isomerase/epimerase [Caldanaerovirga acetigignens]|jgi:sugar phosphate isomerase/epimerase|uniref:Sugar phosphate isomerase/epimerase n=1 Tax=Caldanaerovirga acetigignens TaxID=447595 RepID=A0A1M7LNA7_9FIRM|nr:sugar phosphate isomerase/epimerase [Caldanaerovirga acetigignens]SHM79673.1 Sugar phosphate isomerase/epimerase [Caldanaerovirga acetigignens]